MIRPYSLLLLALAASVWTASPAVGAEGKAPPGDDSKRSGKTKTRKDSDEGPDAPKEDPNKCVSHTQRARFVSGYDHLVTVKNGCSKKVACDVSTDVNPKKQNVSLSPGQTETVLTFRGSPASEFRATVECRFDAETD